MEGLEILARKIMLYIYINTLVIGFMGTANAVAFSDLVDWNHQIKMGRTASMVFNKNGPIALIHDDIILGEGISITEPVLTISHMGNVADKKAGKLWMDQSQLTFNYDIDTPGADSGVSTVPEPATMLLFGVGLTTIAGYRKRYFKRMWSARRKDLIESMNPLVEKVS